MASGNDNFVVTISKEELNSLPIERFGGKIIVVSSEETAVKAAKYLRKAGEIGFDTETKPSFRKGVVNDVALLQLATLDRCYLVRLSKIGYIPLAIKDLLEDENVLKVGLSIKDDFLNLNRTGRMDPKGFIDLQTYVKDFKIKDNSLTKIYSLNFGKRIAKSQQLSNWEASSLTEAQKNYAALDAAACLAIYSNMRAGNFIAENSPYYCKDEETV